MRREELRCVMPADRQLSEVRFLTVAEVAAIMRVSKMTVYRMVHGGPARDRWAAHSECPRTPSIPT